MTQPVFILGAGRCGSTLIQRIINSSEFALIFGEHGGILKFVANMHHHYMNDAGMKVNLFDRVADFRSTVQSRIHPMTDSAWLNTFDQDDLKLYTKRYVETLFCRDLPKATSHWGFKEIRYGDDNVLEMLADLYPTAKIIFSFREPFSSIRSMVLNWDRDLFGSAATLPDHAAVRQRIIHHARRWRSMNEALVRKRDRFAASAWTVRYEDIDLDSSHRLFEFIALPMPPFVEDVLRRKVTPTHETWKIDLILSAIDQSRSEVAKIVEGPARSLGYTVS